MGNDINIEARKVKFVQEFLNLQNEELLTLFEKLLHSVPVKSDEKIKPMTVNELNQRINQSLQDSDSGKLIHSDDLIMEIKKWI